MFMKEYQQYSHPGTKSKECMFQTEENVRLQVIHFIPASKSIYPPVIMVAGLGTFIQSFKGIIKSMTKDFELFYVETREKVSSRLSGKINYDIKTVANDIVSIVKSLYPNLKGYILFGYSYGATVIAESYSNLSPKPSALLLLSPTPSFYYPKWSLPLIKIAPSLFWMIKPAAKWYLRNFVINQKEDKEMYGYTSYALDNCDPKKLSSAILAVAGYSIWDKLDMIDCSTLIVDTSKDGIHLHEDIVRMTTTIKNSTYIDLEVNKRTHGAELAVVIRDYLDTLN